MFLSSRSTGSRLNSEIQSLEEEIEKQKIASGQKIDRTVYEEKLLDQERSELEREREEREEELESLYGQLGDLKGKGDYLGWRRVEERMKVVEGEEAEVIVDEQD